MKTAFAFMLVSASVANASVQPYASDEGSLHPVQMLRRPRAIDPDPVRPSVKPLLLFIRMPDGHIALMGVLMPKNAC